MRYGWFLVGLGVLLAGPRASALAVDYDYAVERFRVQGNLPGDLTDEFDDGSLGSWYVTPGGTVSESGGALHLMGPGFEDSAAYSILKPQIVLNRSDAFSPPEYSVTDGAGNFTSSSEWRNLPDAPGGFYSMGLRYFTSTTMVEAFSLTLSNLDQQTADAFGSIAGLVMGFDFSTYDVIGQALLSTESERFAIDPGDITGNIVLQLSFDDVANELSAAVSLDGGTSFANGFASRATDLSYSIFGGPNFFLFADPATVVPEPSTGLLVAAGLLVLASRRSRLG